MATIKKIQEKQSDGTVKTTYPVTIASAVMNLSDKYGQDVVANVLETLLDAVNGAGTNIATKLGSSTVGSSTAPIYLNGGTATACGSSLAVDITGNAATATTATSATKATQDGDGNVISTTYFKTTGGTISGATTLNGNLTVKGNDVTIDTNNSITLTPYSDVYIKNGGDSGGLQIEDTLTVGSRATIGGATTINGTLTVSGATTINDTLTVGSSGSTNGNTTIHGNLDVQEDTTLGTTKIEDLTITGDATINDTLTVSGAATLNNVAELYDTTNKRSLLGFMPCANKNSGIDIDATSYTGYGLSVIGVEREQADGTFPSGATSNSTGGIILQGHYYADGVDVFTQLFMSNKGVFYRHYSDPEYNNKPFDGVSWTQL